MSDFTNQAFETFAALHPIEAYDYDNQKFCNYMRNRGYNMTDDEIKNFINDFR